MWAINSTPMHGPKLLFPHTPHFSPVHGPKLLLPHLNLDRVSLHEHGVHLPRPMQANEGICLLSHRHALKQIPPKGEGPALHSSPSSPIQHPGPVTGSGAVAPLNDLIKIQNLTDSRINCHNDMGVTWGLHGGYMSKQ